MLNFAPFNLKPNYENIISLIKGDQKYLLLEILSQDNIIQSINHQNTQISQFLFTRISDLFNIALGANFNYAREDQLETKDMVNPEKFNDHEIDNGNSKIELPHEYNIQKISSNAREVLIALSINFPAQFSENPAFHSKMNHFLDIINEKENNLPENSKSEIVETREEERYADSNISDELKKNVEEFPTTNININLSAVLLSRIIFSLGKSENYSILASLSDNHEFFPKFCSLLGTHCAVYDALFDLSNDDMPAVSLFFEDMDTTEVLLEMIKKSISLRNSINDEEKINTSQSNSQSILNNYNVSFTYFNINDIFRMQKRALIIINHLISNAEKDSILIKNLSEKIDYLNFIFEELGLNSSSKEVSAGAFSLLIRLYQISSNPTVVNKSAIYNPFMNAKPQIPQSNGSDYDDYDLDSDSDYEESDCFDTKNQKKIKKNSENSKRAKKVPLIKTYFESNASKICQYIINSQKFSVAIEKALDILCLILHSPDIQDMFFNQIDDSNLLQLMIEKLADDFFNFPNCSILHTNFRKIFTLILKIEEQRQENSDEKKKNPFVLNICNYLKEKIIQFLSKEHENEDKITINSNQFEQETINNVFDLTNPKETDSLNDANKDQNKEITQENDINENTNSPNKDENSNSNNNDNLEEDKARLPNDKYTNFARYDFSNYCFWGFVVELADLINNMNEGAPTPENENIFWNKFIQNDLRRFKDIISREYGGSPPLGTRQYGKILCVKSPSSKSSSLKPKCFTKKASETLNFDDDSEED